MKKKLKSLSVLDTWIFQDNINYTNKIIQGINEELVRQISKSNNEPLWMLEFRLKSLEIFKIKPMPSYGPNLSKLDLDSIYYYTKPEWAWNNKSWDQVPDNIKNTFDRLWIPEAEKKSLAWVWAQYDSEVVYHNLKKDLVDKWVIFEDTSIALNKYWKLFKKYFLSLFLYLIINFLHYIMLFGLEVVLYMFQKE